MFPAVLDIFLELPPPGHVSKNTPLLVSFLRVRTLLFMCHSFDTAEANHFEALFSDFPRCNLDSCGSPTERYRGRKRSDFNSYPESDIRLNVASKNPVPWAYPAAANVILGYLHREVSPARHG